MRYSDFIKPQNRKVLTLQERADKQAGSPSVKPVLSGNAGAGVGAVIPAKAAPDAGAHANAGAGLGIGLSNPAYLAGLLPDDFPIDQWEQLNTKQQLNAMKYSGLTPQEQWVLLNTNIPLVELRSSSSASSGSIARIVNPNANAPRDRFAAGNAENGLLYPSNSPNSAPLHNIDLIGKLKDKAASPATPNPASTPLPTPGPSPMTTPNLLSEPSPYSGTTPMELTSRDKQMLLSILDLDKSLMSVTDRKQIEFIKRQVQRGVVTPNQLKQFYQDLISIRNKVEKQEWTNKVKAESSATATWGNELINNQRDYSGIPGSFGKKGNMRDNACGYMAINNTNQLLGYNTAYSDTSYYLNKARNITTLLDGQLGMNPLIIGGLYRSAGCHVDLYLNTSDIPKTYDAYIMLYFYKNVNNGDKLGAHYIAVDYDPRADKFSAYNNDNSNLQEKDAFNKFLPDDHRGYCIWGISHIDQSQNTDSTPNERNERY
ncbi:MAG TPA: hypothetical protein PKA81_02655 [Clostridia bacterium]|nr:hypothetical protein [Clostridia bacterium]